MPRKITDVELSDTLCNNNLSVQWRIKQFKKTKDMTLLNECLDILRCMKKQGQRMENRLRKYYDAITGLNFERVKKNKS